MLFSNLLFSSALARQHLVILTAEVNSQYTTGIVHVTCGIRDMICLSDVYNPEAYADYREFFEKQEDIEIAISKLSVINESETDASKIQSILPNIERALSEVEAIDNYGKADTFFTCHGKTCNTLDLLLKTGIYDEITKGIIYLGSATELEISSIRHPDYGWASGWAFLTLISNTFI